MVGNRIETVICHSLASFGRQHLQEADLVRVGFVGEGEATIGWNVSEPDLPLLSFERHLIRDGWLRLNTRLQSLHVTVDQDGILGIASIGIHPVLKETKIMIICNRCRIFWITILAKLTSPVGFSGCAT
jgi:hypothetical protein